jgi:hypothetical protein
MSAMTHLPLSHGFLLFYDPFSIPSSRIPGGRDRGRFDHQHQRALGSTWPVLHPLGNHDPLLGSKLNGAAFKVDEQLAFDNIKEFVFPVMAVPVKLALEYAQSHQRIVDPAQGLVEPVIVARFFYRPDIDLLQCPELDVAIDHIFRFWIHETSYASFAKVTKSSTVPKFLQTLSIGIMGKS